ncbi:MAG: hypothetical protein QM689_01265 [Oscillospiraceae bacterium]
MGRSAGQRDDPKGRRRDLERLLESTTKEVNNELDISFSPWLDWNGTPKIGWWISALAINPFNNDEVYLRRGRYHFQDHQDSPRRIPKR